MRKISCWLGCIFFCASNPGFLPLAQPVAPERIEKLAEGQLDQALQLYRQLLSLPNDAHYPQDIRRLVEWLEAAFEERKFTTLRLPTQGSPLLLAEREFAGPEARTVLVYLQSDGQPVDPSRWEQDDPFEPVLKERGEDGWRIIPWQRLQDGFDPEWRIFARSASDSKGPIAQFLSALDAMEKGGFQPGFNLKVIVDTEEEMGSPHLPQAVQRFRQRLAADMMVILDGPPHYSNRPTLKFGARGIATFTLTVYGARTPQHSGHYGNYLPNPALRLARILASMKDEQGRVVIAGFYEGLELTPQVKRVLARVPDDEADIQRRLGVAARDSVGDNLQEAVQYPSLNIRGLSSGWVGEQARTIVPATATAEVDVRLVKESDPERLLRLVRQHIQGLGYYLTEGEPSEEERLAQAKIASFTSVISYPAFRTEFDSLPGRWLNGALTRLYGHEPIKIRTSGGSIPIAPFVETLGVPAVSLPTVNPDNNQHSPNENLRLGNFLEGIKLILAFLSEEVPG